jgi:hypothetical protein
VPDGKWIAKAGLDKMLSDVAGIAACGANSTGDSHYRVQH